ncbi:MAG TPA: MFS transporter [Bacteroidia bacterium]|nr:MFS transporter [Bacteroidia bacterium]
MKAITRTIWILSLVSLFNDIASEMLLPIMPIYLKSIGFTVVIIGVLEGLAEAVSSLSKGYFGKISDKYGHRAAFVKWGYALSAISKPIMVLFVNPLWVFFSRTLERLGKGIRTAPRDAILADESAHGDRGRVFGFHRSMDTVGAAIGPSIALLYLYFHHEQYKTLFYIAFFPGIIVVLMTLGLKDKHPKAEPRSKSKPKIGFFSQFKYWKESTPAYRALVSGLLFFALFNSADAFLILKMKESGIDDTMVIVIYIFYNLVFALTSFPIGIIGDKVGFKTMMLIGLLIFGFVYFGMAFANSKVTYFILFFCYGLYYACTDGISKAWISKTCEKKDTATALGVFSGLQSICTFVASSLAGFIWYKFGSVYVFCMAGAVAFLVIVYLLFSKLLITSKPSL